MDAKKKRFSDAEIMGLVGQVDAIHAAKGKKVVSFDLRKEKPARDAILAVLKGPSGNLRAPTLRVGRTLLVGFDEATYKRFLG